MSTESPSNGSPPVAEAVNRSLAARWHYEKFFDKGFVAVPSRFLELYAHLDPYPLSPSEALFVLELMSFKWSKEAPYPSYRRIAERMNVSDKMVRRYAQMLETKKYLRRRERKNQTNLFDLTGLFKALLRAAERYDQHGYPADFKKLVKKRRREEEKAA